MNKQAYLLLLLMGIFFGTSCTQKFYYQDAISLNKAIKQKTGDSLDIIVKTKYAGDALDYIIFELDLQNNSSDTLFFNSDDIVLEMDQSVIKVLDKKEIIAFLQSENFELERERKRRNAQDAIFIGLDLLSFAFAPGLGSVDALFYSLDATSYILEDRRQLNLAQGSIEEQIEYVDQWSISDEFLEPGASDSWDILFDRLMVNEKATLTLNLGGNEYFFDYDLYIAEGKMKR